jgi:hypothetical protein
MVVTITVRGPEWFFGVDSLFEGFAALAAILITLFSIKAYRFTKDRRYLTFALGFGLMALGQVSRAIADLLVYLGAEVRPIWLLGSYAGYMGLTLIAFLVLFALTLKARQRASLVALTLIAFVGVLLSSSYRMAFHSMSFILLVFIAFHFIRNYFQKKSLTALLVCGSFIGLALTQVAFIFDILQHRFYIVGHLIHLAAFALLFVALLKVKVLVKARRK